MARYLDITGQRYGRLVVVEYTETDKNRQAKWLCKCDCGNTKIISANALRRGLTKSCGCLNDEVRRSGINRIGHKNTDEMKRKMSERKKGVPNPVAVEKSARARKGRPLPEETKRKISEAQKGKSRPPEQVKKAAQARIGIRFKRKKKRIISDEQRRKQSETMKSKGSANHLYIDGKCADRHDERKIAYMTVEYKIWRDSVFRRDNYTCQLCGEKPRRVEADHIQAWSTHPELRYELSNGRTLCVECHRKTPTYARKLKK